MSITLDKARELIAKYPDHDAFVKMKNEESIAKGDGDNSIRMSNLWAHCKDMIWQADSYNPVGCDHKKANGWSAWECYSEGHHIRSEEYSDTYLFVCLKCGDIKVSGRHRGIYFEQIVSIHWANALKAIIKQANYMYEGKLFTKGINPSDFNLASYDTFAKEPVAALLVNALKYCNPEQRIALRNALNERTTDKMFSREEVRQFIEDILWEEYGEKACRLISQQWFDQKLKK